LHNYFDFLFLKIFTIKRIREIRIVALRKILLNIVANEANTHTTAFRFAPVLKIIKLNTFSQ